MASSDLVLMGRRTIQQEAQALSALVDRLDDSFAEACELLHQCKGTVVMTGMGKSGLVARKWASTFSGTGTKAYFLSPAEAVHGDLGMLRSEDVLIALSSSGETEELSFITRFARENGLPILAVTRKPESSLAQQASLVLQVSLDEEACPLGLAPTTSTTVMMALGDALATTLMQMRGFAEEDFARLHPGGALGRRLWLRVDELMHDNEDLPLLKPDADFGAVLMEMTQKRLGLAVVTGASLAEIRGVITDGDLRRFLQKGTSPASVQAQDLMTQEPKTIRSGALAIEAREKMEALKIQHLLVVDGSSSLLGVIHLQDLLRAKVV